MATAALVAMAILAGGGLALLLFSRWLPATGSAWAALGLGIGSLLPFLLLHSGPTEIALAQWAPVEGWSISVAYRFDGLAGAMALLAGLPALLLLLWLALGAPQEEGGFAPWVLLLMAFYLHLLSSADLLLAYASWEAMLLILYLLLAYRREALPTPGIAEWFLGIQHLAGYPLLFALLWVGQPLRTLQYASLGQGGVFPAALFLLLGTVWVRMAQVPFQGWALAIAESPGPVSTLVLGGWGLLAGPYLWLRMLSLVAEHTPREFALIAGSVSLVLGAVLALRQESARRIQAGDTVSRLGLLWIALGLDSPLGVAAGLFLLLDLLLSKVVFHAALSSGRGIARPVRQGLMLLGMWGVLGLPPSLGFVGRWLLVLGLIQAGRLPYLPVLLLALPLTLAYLWRAWNLLPRQAAGAPPLRSAAGWAIVGVAALLALSGLAAPWLWQFPMAQAGGTVFGTVSQVQRPLEALLGWMPAGAIVLAFVVGGGLWWSGALRRPVAPAPDGPAEGPLQEPLAVLPQETTWLAWLGRPAPLYRLLGQLALLLGTAINSLVNFLERHTTYFLLVVLIAATLVLIILTR
jgi:multicomponent Na+:H+ antiporter subunit D